MTLIQFYNTVVIYLNMQFLLALKMHYNIPDGLLVDYKSTQVNF